MQRRGLGIMMFFMIRAVGKQYHRGNPAYLLWSPMIRINHKRSKLSWMIRTHPEHHRRNRRVIQASHRSTPAIACLLVMLTCLEIGMHFTIPASCNSHTRSNTSSSNNNRKSSKSRKSPKISNSSSKICPSSKVLRLEIAVWFGNDCQLVFKGFLFQIGFSYFS